MTFENPILSKLTLVSAESTDSKYNQIVEAVLRGLEDGVIGRSAQLPSINAVCKRYSISRDTVVKAYNRLKEMGVVASHHGKAFHIAVDTFSRAKNVFVMFDVIGTAYKERLHQGIVESLGDKALLDFYFHHFNAGLFCQLLEDARGKYEYYVVMPFPDDRIRDCLAAFDQTKLMLLDIDIGFPDKNCSVIRQSHDTELRSALASGLDAIRRYDSFTLAFPDDKHHPVVIKDAFAGFCREHGIACSIKPLLSEDDVEPGRAFLVIEDSDLVALVRGLRTKKLKPGKDIGFISYNDTILKEIIEGGVTVVSIDFHAMGGMAARQILLRSPAKHLLPTRLIMRSSL